MTTIRKLSDGDYQVRQRAWEWMRSQPEIYRDFTGFDSFRDFIEPGFEAYQDFVICRHNIPIGFLTCILRAPNVTEVSLITPSQVKPRPLLQALKQMQDDYMQQVGGTLMMQSNSTAARKLVRVMGWQTEGQILVYRGKRYA